MNPALLRLAIALFTWGLGEGTFFYFQPLYLAELGADPFMIGKILGAVGIAMTIVHVPAGYLADKVGRLPLLRASWSLGLIATIAMATSKTLPLFVSGLILYSLTTFVIAPLNSYVTAARGKWTVGRAITLVSATFSLGMVSGPLIGGWLGDHFGLRSLYVAALSVFTISTILIYSLPAQPLHSAAKSFSAASILQNKRYWNFLLLTFFVIFTLHIPQPLTQNFLQDERGLSLGQIGFLGSLGGVGNVILNLGLGQLSAFFGILLSQIAIALYALLIWKGTGMSVYGIAYLLLGGYRSARSLSAAHVNSLIDDAQMGLAYGITETANALPFIIAPPLAGYFYIMNPASPYPLSLLLIFVGILATLIFFPRSRKQMDEL